MIRDGIFKAICIPLLGVIIPWVAHLLCCPQPTTGRLLVTLLFFTLASLAVWQTVAGMIARLRTTPFVRMAFARKILVLALASMLLSFVLGSVACILWQWFALQTNILSVTLTCGALYASLGLLLALLYEAIFLSKERELDVKIVDQLDRERMHAEITALKAELDPHFIFNALTTVSHLTGESPETARAFTQKLAQVYKYFLINKERDLISLHDELRFIEDYFYLLQIRYDNGVRLHMHIPTAPEAAMIVPCALQLLVENAIKHNRFSEREPLNICVKVAGASIVVQNELRRHPYAVESTHIGLPHLRQHYRLLGNLDIVVDETDHAFSVTIPLIKQQNL
jgi:two-component system, LytTR family, sensor kinase